MNSKIWLSSPHMGGTEQNYIKEAMDSNWVAPMGANVTGFEEDLKTYLGGSVNVTALSSGTAALHLALILAGVQPGDEVICQSMTFVASANPIVYQGAHPIFVDSELDTWNMDPFYLEQAIKDRISKGKTPKAIILVHLYGMPAKVNEISSIAKKYNIPLIEDAAEALGSSYIGQKCGVLGDYGILSFNGNKIITTSGGGALVCKTNAQKDRALSLATQAKDDAPHYQHSEIGYNYRMSNISAGIGRGQMEVLNKHVEFRREMHDFYLNLFKNTDGISVFDVSNTAYFSNYWLSCILIDESITGFSADDLRLALLSDHIESRPLWKPLHLQPVFKNTPFYGGNTSEQLFNKGLCLPSGSNLTVSDKERIENLIKLFLSNPSFFKKID